MQVFKLFFKILKKYRNQMIMYVGIFISLLFAVFIPNAKKSDNVYQGAQCKYAVFDYDNSEVSKALCAQLEAVHLKKEIANDKESTIQDELYARNVYCVVRIKEGYGESFLRGDLNEKMEIYVIPQTSTAGLFEQDLKGYASTLYTYIAAGYRMEEAVKLAGEAEKISVEVSLRDGSDVGERTAMEYMVQYLGWIFVAMCVNGIAPVLTVLDKKEIRDRIGCSAYPFSRINAETILGVLAVGMIICAVFAVTGLIGMPSELLSVQGMFYMMNMVCYMVVALSITFLVSKLTSKNEVISVLANIISLGMAFLCGVFVPLEFLSNVVVTIAHFLPAYWYVRNINAIGSYSAQSLPEIVICMGIQLLFATAITMIAVIVYRKKRVA